MSFISSRTPKNPTGFSYLAAGGLGEPQGPFVHKRVLHVEVLGVVENGDGIASLIIGDRSGVLIGHSRSTILCDGSHGELMWRGGETIRVGKSEGRDFRGKRKSAFHTKKDRRNLSLGRVQQEIICSRQCETRMEVDNKMTAKSASFEVRATKTSLASLGSSVT